MPCGRQTKEQRVAKEVAVAEQISGQTERRVLFESGVLQTQSLCLLTS